MCDFSDTPRACLLPGLEVSSAAQPLAWLLADVTRKRLGEVRVTGQARDNTLGDRAPIWRGNCQRHVTSLKGRTTTSIAASLTAITPWTLWHYGFGLVVHNRPITRRALVSPKLAPIAGATVLLSIMQALRLDHVSTAAVTAATSQLIRTHCSFPIILNSKEALISRQPVRLSRSASPTLRISCLLPGQPRFLRPAGN